MKRRVRAALTGVTLALTPAAAESQNKSQVEPTPPATTQTTDEFRIDTNGDGEYSAEEIRAAINETARLSRRNVCEAAGRGNDPQCLEHLADDALESARDEVCRYTSDGTQRGFDRCIRDNTEHVEGMTDFIQGAASRLRDLWGGRRELERSEPDGDGPER